jgi:hypothetical protein
MKRARSGWMPDGRKTCFSCINVPSVWMEMFTDRFSCGEGGTEGETVRE